MTSFPLVVFVLAAMSAAIPPPTTPPAAARPEEINFKDMVLAICISRTYQTQREASADAASTARVLVEWTRYEAEVAPDEIALLLRKYTQRNYQNPIADDVKQTSQFSLLKCLDLYHSHELANLTRRVVTSSLPQAK